MFFLQITTNFPYPKLAIKRVIFFISYTEYKNELRRLLLAQ